MSVNPESDNASSGQQFRFVCCRRLSQEVNSHSLSSIVTSERYAAALFYEPSDESSKVILELEKIDDEADEFNIREIKELAEVVRYQNSRKSNQPRKWRQKHSCKTWLVYIWSVATRWQVFAHRPSWQVFADNFTVKKLT